MPTAGNAPPRPGSRRIAGRYLLTGALGSGAMCVVWSGFDEALKRDVAVKELTVPRGVQFADREALRERVLREARTLGGLSHPNVIIVYDVVEDGGEPFVVLELLVSRSLSELVTDRGRLGVAEAAAVGVAIAAALRSVHRAGITHRDVKPGNVLVAGDGRIKLTDFGIARNVADSTMTTTGLVLGSPAYIAPEVAAGGPVTPAADLWGLGATLFAVVEGRPPYDADGDAIATITEVVAGPVPRSSVGGPLAEVIAGLMRKDPGGRLPLTEVLRRLSPLLPDPTLPRFPVSRDSRNSRDAPGALRGAGVPAPRTGNDYGPAARPVGGRVPAPRAGSGAEPAAGVARHRDVGAPLAADPGPLPAGPPPAGPPTDRPVRAGDPHPLQIARPAGRRRPARAAASAALLVLAVLVGVVGGWTATRMLAGQPPLTAPPAAVPAQPVELVTHIDPVGFTLLVPPGWSEVEGGQANPVARFVGPDGAAELRVDRLDGNRSDPDDFVSTLTARRLGVDRVTVEDPLRDVGERQFELRYRTEDAEGERVVWARLVPRGDDLWVLRLAGSGGPEQAALFGRIADGFTSA